MSKIVIGLTGGIGSGKSTVCQLFAQYGIAIIDADLIAREIVQPGQPTLEAIIQLFGPRILNADGTLNRSALRDIVFADPQALAKLNGIMHPTIFRAIDYAVAQAQSVYCVVAVPLLVETGCQNRFDRILVINCDTKTQIQRVSQRDQLAAEQIQAIIDSQLPANERAKYADDLIINNGNFEILAEQVKKLHNSYIQLASARTPSA